jgi:hypothetical protein
MSPTSHPPGFRTSDFGPLASDFLKPRADARLKTLPDERQADIADFARTHSLAQTAKWLGEREIKTSISAVSQFLRWYRTKQAMAQNEASLRKELADVVRKDPSALRVDKLGHTLFSVLALKNQDPIAWCRCQNIALRKGQF